ncbi:hypothetical protein ES703_64181 [subsurface metagenome]
MGLAAQTSDNRAVILHDSCAHGCNLSLDIHIMLVIRCHLTVKKLSVFIRLPHLLKTLLEKLLLALYLLGCLIPAGHCGWGLEHDQPSGVVIVEAGIDIGMGQLEFIHVAAFGFGHRVGISCLEIPAVGKVPVRVRASDIILVDHTVSVVIVSFRTDPSEALYCFLLITDPDELPLIGRQLVVSFGVFNVHCGKLAVSIDILCPVLIVQPVPVVVLGPVRLTRIIRSVGKPHE